MKNDQKQLALAKFIILKTEIVPMSKVTPAEWNPRIITDKRFKDLVTSIQEDPQFMVLRPILASKKGTIYAGNMRYRALSSLGYKECPVIYTDISEELAVRRSIKDNTHFGDFQADELSELASKYKITPLHMELMALPKQIIQAITGPEDGKPPSEFVQFDADIKTDFKCPKCSYAWSGKPQ